MIRKIVHIDEEKCDGCGKCVPSCAEGAIRLEDGKARLSSDVLCDGLGACLGECPRGAITIVEREAPAFDEAAVTRHFGRRSPVSVVPEREQGGCPGSRATSWGGAGSGRAPSSSPTAAGPADRRPRLRLLLPEPPAARFSTSAASGSRLGQWPVQLHLVSTAAPYFQGADLLVAADCVPFAFARFHEDLLDGRRVVVGCPKLDDNRFYVEKLAELFRISSLRSVTVAKMEVPCCSGIAWAVRQALEAAGKSLPYREVTIRIRGDVRNGGR